MKDKNVNIQLKKYIDDICIKEGAILTGYTKIRKTTNTLVITYPYPDEIFVKNFWNKSKKLKEEYFKNKEIHEKIISILNNEGYKSTEKTILSIYGDLRPIAKNANIGDYGMNGLIVNKKYGSNMLFSNIYTDAPIVEEDIINNNLIKSGGCIKCKKCIISCPAKAFDGGSFNFFKCLPYSLKGCNECSRYCKMK